MFRNPRENAVRNLQEKLNPSVGRAPSPPPLSDGTATRYTTTTMAVETATLADPPRLGTLNKPKNPPPKNSKSKFQANSSILSFFKKAEHSPGTSSLFVEDRSKVQANLGFPGIINDQSHDQISEPEEVVEISRFNETSNSIKRRKTSHSPPLVEERLTNGTSETFDKKEYTLPRVDDDVEQTLSTTKGADHDNTEQPLFTNGHGPFLDESDSEDEGSGLKTATLTEKSFGVRDRQEKPDGQSCASPKENQADKQDAKHTPTAEPPSLKREPTSVAEGDGFADFEGMDDFEDEYEEGEEYVEKRYMHEQRRLEAEAGLRDDFDDDEPADIRELGTRNDPMDVKVEAEARQPSNQTTPSCPVCSVSLEGVSDQDASVHVNNCLDGKPTPLPSMSEKPSSDPPEPSNAAKRFIRPPKPGQQNPFALGQPSGTSSSAFTKLMSGHSEETAWSAAASSERESRGKPSYQRTCPFYKILPGFYTCVDAFRYGAVAGCNAYFLSHFHSDHYIGLTSNWSNGKIYCSRITANLVRQQLRVDPKWVVDLEWEEKVEVPNTQGVYVTMIPANHCPGSSLFLFEKDIDPPKNAPSTAKPRTQRVLHCGDFRACPAHIAHPRLAPEVVDSVTGKLKHQRIDVCYLDTTYLNPKYAFPSQEDVITACADMCVSLSKQRVDTNDSYETMKRERAGSAMAKFVHKDSTDCPTTKDASTEDNSAVVSRTKHDRQTRGDLLVVVGTYSIGKERICLGIARALNSLIYAPPAKQRICAALNDAELNKRLTTDPLAASVHMTPLFEIRAETLSEYLESYKGRFHRAVGFRPSGWNYRPPGSRGDAPTVNQVLYSPGWKSTFGMRDLAPQRGSSDKAAVFGVPYSEHSSFRELSMFVCGLRIERIIPTVNVGSAKTREKMRAWCERWSTERGRNGLFRVRRGEEEEGGEDSGGGEFYTGQGTWELRTTL